MTTDSATPRDLRDLDDHALAAHLAGAAGRLLIELRAASVANGARGWVLEQAGDMAANRFLVDALREARPDDSLLSEEEYERPATTEARLASRRVWIIDPLDGTREFGQPERTDWAVHIALTIDGEPVAGAVGLPADDVVFDTATVTPAVHSPEPGRGLRVVTSRTRPPNVSIAIAEALGAELVPMGSAGAKAMAVLRGDADVYAHAGGQYEWDSCAPVAVCRSAGLWCSRIDGSPLVYNRADPYLPDLLICDPTVRDTALAAAQLPPWLM
ncbi:MAG: 3'(2'),5'-bisphosphate nucleotidase CysQ [Microthrixaceae bacterium]